ncbi:hypothetical protein [Treponema socranskii]|nr:hypothetical protein [Treponema socranskii]MDR9859857.1 hypothetical protein [Treponema socranskii]
MKGIINREGWMRAVLRKCTEKALITISLEIEFDIELAMEKNKSF